MSESHSRRILIVEDDQDVRDIYSEFLVAFGYQVFEASDGEQAYSLLARDGLTVDAVLTDLRMPRMNGLEFAAKIKSDPRLATMPVILLTATPLDGSPHAAAIFAAILTKPCPLERLISTIKAIH